MNIQFTGATLVRGSADKVQAFLKREENIVGNVTTTRNGEGIELDGKDAAAFLKKEYDLEIPAEFVGQDAEKMSQALERNPMKYMPMLLKLLQMVADGPALDGKLQAFFDRIKASGADAEGKPVREVDV
jgi:hypothetical protein